MEQWVDWFVTIVVYWGHEDYWWRVEKGEEKPFKLKSRNDVGDANDWSREN